MEQKRYMVCAKIGLQASLEFCAIHSAELSTDSLVYVEVDKEGVIVPSRGVLSFDSGLRRMAIAYLGFKMVLDVLDIKTVGDSHHFKCVTDLCRVDVYICDESKWKKDGESLFF